MDINNPTSGVDALQGLTPAEQEQQVETDPFEISKEACLAGFKHLGFDENNANELWHMVANNGEIRQADFSLAHLRPEISASTADRKLMKETVALIRAAALNL